MFESVFSRTAALAGPRPRGTPSVPAAACCPTGRCLRFDVDSDVTDEQLATLLKLTERYCVILQTLRTPPRLWATLQRSAA